MASEDARSAAPYGPIAIGCPGVIDFQVQSLSSCIVVPWFFYVQGVMMYVIGFVKQSQTNETDYFVSTDILFMNFPEGSSL